METKTTNISEKTSYAGYSDSKQSRPDASTH